MCVSKQTAKTQVNLNNSCAKNMLHLRFANVGSFFIGIEGKKCNKTYNYNYLELAF